MWLSMTVDIAKELCGRDGVATIALPTDIGETMIRDGVLFNRNGKIVFVHLNGSEIEVLLGGTFFTIKIDHA